MLFKPKKDIIGIDVGADSVKLIQLKEVKGNYQLLNMGIAPLPPEAIVDNAIMDSGAVVDALGSLVESLKIKTRNVASSVSGHSVIIRKIIMSIMTEEELESSIQWEAEQYIPFELSEVNIDFQILGPDAKDPSQMHVLLVAAKKEFVNDYVNVFKEAKLTPLVLDIDSFALQNVYEVNYETGDNEIVALIDMGKRSLNVNILKGKESIFTRDIQTGGQIFNEEIQKRLGLNSEDAERAKCGESISGVDPSNLHSVLVDVSETLSQEVQRSLDFFTATSADEKVHKMYITGGISKIPQIKEALIDRFDISVEMLDPFRQIIVDEKNFDPEYVRSVGPLFSVAIGLAMRRLGDK